MILLDFFNNWRHVIRVCACVHAYVQCVGSIFLEPTSERDSQLKLSENACTPLSIQNQRFIFNNPLTLLS